MSLASSETDLTPSGESLLAVTKQSHSDLFAGISLCCFCQTLTLVTEGAVGQFAYFITPYSHHACIETSCTSQMND
uniref:Uncharacterized protein n=1 Tax=Seriola dumerili TaxID=41447 RepID=A0A3B4UFA6_SERDU